MNQEPAPDVVTWVYEDGSYVPSAKLVNDQRYSIVSDYLGRPVQAYSDRGQLVWQTDYDIYGGLRDLEGEREFIPFRQLGQYEDEETGLYYNRFRYYDSSIGSYISQDLIGLGGNNPTFYGYVNDSNSWCDFLGLKCANIKNGVLEIEQKFPKGSTEAIELEDFVKKWNEQISPGGLTRQAVPKDVRKAASDAADAYKKINPDLFKNGEVAGHIPDVGWRGSPQGPFMPLSPAVNSYIGGATQAVTVGTKYTSVVLI